jgi:uncharacterized protein
MMNEIHPELPAPLATIASACRSAPPPLFPETPWCDAHSRKHIRLLETRVPEAQVKRNGEDVWLGSLSPGCQACKAGRWDCVFITMRCNRNCTFCLRPNAPQTDPPTSVFGPTPAAAAATLSRIGIQGVSFSGGEALLEPALLIGWLTEIRRACPDAYFWIYTNGLIGDRGYFERLRDAGIHEMRFNLAACGYTNAAAMARVAMAADLFTATTVEIPAIPDDRARLSAALPTWCSAGVRFLNLHELIHQAGSNSGSLAGPSRPFMMPDGHACRVASGSRELTAAIIAHVRDRALPLSVNDCSMQSKVRQMRGRLRLAATAARRSHERVTAVGLLESVAVWRGSEVRLEHPDAVNVNALKQAGWQLVRLARSVGVRPDADSRWVRCEVVP